MALSDILWFKRSVQAGKIFETQGLRKNHVKYDARIHQNCIPTHPTLCLHIVASMNHMTVHLRGTPRHLKNKNNTHTGAYAMQIR